MKISIGIDQSYKRTGLSICKDGKVSEYFSIDYEGCKSNTDKRKYLANRLHKVIQKCLSECKSGPQNVVIIIERIRIVSHGFLSTNYLIQTGALVATIIDVAYEHSVKVYSVDTRSWKSQIVGSSKARTKMVEITKGKNKGKMKKVLDTKSETMEFCKNKLGIDCCGNDDMADSICISLYPFIKKKDRKLKQEV